MSIAQITHTVTVKNDKTQIFSSAPNFSPQLTSHSLRGRASLEVKNKKIKKNNNQARILKAFSRKPVRL